MRPILSLPLLLNRGVSTISLGEGRRSLRSLQAAKLSFWRLPQTKNE